MKLSVRSCFGINLVLKWDKMFPVSQQLANILQKLILCLILANKPGNYSALYFFPWHMNSGGSVVVRTVCTSVDEEDVVLVDRTMNHVWVWLAGQQMLVEPLTAILEGLRGKTRLHTTVHSTFLKLITTLLSFQCSDCGFFSLHWRLRKLSVLKYKDEAEVYLHNTVYAFVL